jgi:hypothetical protein
MQVSARGQLTAGAKLVIALYFVAFAALPFAHHDLACHVRSSTHCDVCHIGTSTDTSGGHAPLLPLHLEDAGRAIDVIATAAFSAVVVPSAGRSPPSSIVSL